MNIVPRFGDGGRALLREARFLSRKGVGEGLSLDAAKREFPLLPPFHGLPSA